MTGTVDVRTGSARRVRLPDRARPTRHQLGTSALVLLLAGLSVLARLPFLTRPLSSDEGGFLMVAAQWSHGTSLYGDYWVDRPPLLVELFRVADLLGGGGAVGLRLLGAAWVGSSVVLAAAVARAALRLEAPGRHQRLVVAGAAATAAVFLASPLVGATEIDGELLAVPFVLGGLTAALTAYRTADPRWWAAAGALGVAAGAVKQNMLEVLVAVVVLLVVLARRAPQVAARAALATTGGALLTGLGLLGWAALHGTTPTELWDAVVTFRLEASALIARSAPAVAHTRGLRDAAAFAGSGALVLVLLALLPRRVSGPRPSRVLVAVTAAVLGWEAFGVVAGGSYWLHYLVGTVPGLVLATVAAGCGGRVRRAGVAAVLAYAAAATGVAIVASSTSPPREPSAAAAVAAYLSAHERPGDTGVTAFGDPALLQVAGLPSPYPQLWSLPVRVRDPHLTELTHVMASPDRPTWMVVHGDSLASWGIDPTRAQPVLDREYRLVHVDGEWHVFHVLSRP